MMSDQLFRLCWFKPSDKVSIEKSNSQLTYDEPDDVLSGLEPSQIQDLLAELRSAMKEAAKNLDFEEAARLRDRVFELEQHL